MSKQNILLLLLLTAATCALIAGCTSQPAAPAVSMVQITSPANSASLPAGNVAVSIQVQNFTIVEKQGQASVPGEGHVHYYLDVSPIPSDPSKPAIPADANATWAHMATNTYTFTNVSPGVHTITVQLANNDHTPVTPLATSSVMVTLALESTSTPTPTQGGQNTTVSLIARNNAFDKGTITVSAGARIEMAFDNQDSGIPHNFALYTDSTARTSIFKGDFLTGPKKVIYTFTAPSQPGTYFFRCDVHPITMTGSFIVT